MTLPQEHLGRAFAQLFEISCRNVAVRDECTASLQGFGLSPSTAADPNNAHKVQRHLEWFLLERHSEALDAVPVEAALHAGDHGEFDESLGQEVLDALLSSLSGAFEVTGVVDGEGVWVRDLAGLGEYPLQEPEGSRALEAGDLLVGRIYAVGESLYRMSFAAGFFRNPSLREALLRDLEQARQTRRGVLRLSRVMIADNFYDLPRLRYSEAV